MRRVYLDNNATTPLLPEVFDAMRPYFLEEYGNASSIHQYGQQARAAVERAREQVAKLLNCRAAEVVFTSGGTEGDNLGIFGLLGDLAPGDHVITSKIEHSAVSRTCAILEEMGCSVTYLGVDAQGLLDPEAVREALTPRTKLITLMMANNETGAIQPVNEIGTIAAEADVFFHTDAVQAAGKIPIDVKAIQCDALTISGHKIHAPKGVGALYVKRGTLLKPRQFGGRHERERRAGTENVPGIVAMGKAAEIARLSLTNGEVERLRALRDRFEQGVLAAVDECFVNSGNAPRVPTTSSICFEHIEGEALIIALDLKGVAASTGAACSSGSLEPSKVLLAMGLTNQQARSSLRFSLGKQTTEEDIEYALSILPETVSRLRALSPVYNKGEGTAALS